MIRHPTLMHRCKLANRASAVTAALAELDVRPEDRVLIMLPDGPGLLETVLGVMQRGAVPLSVNPRLAAADLAAIAAGQVPGWCWLQRNGSLSRPAWTPSHRFWWTGRGGDGAWGSRAAAAQHRRRVPAGKGAAGTRHTFWRN